MTRRKSKHGTTYTEGSSSALAGWEPRVCCWCGSRIVVTREAAGFLMDDVTGEAFAWHTACGASPNRVQEAA